LKGSFGVKMSFVKPDIPPSSSSHDAADWIEFKVLSSSSGNFNVSTLSRMIELQSDSDSIAYAQDDLISDDTISRWLQEIDLRQTAIGNSYPFILNQNKFSLKSSSDQYKPGRYAYLLCLMLSHSKNTDVLDGKSLLDIENNDLVRKYFQSISTLAAGGFIRGNSISFGHPRQDNTNFVNALQRVVKYAKDGATLRQEPHAAAPNKVKDYEIDIISWIPSNDSLPGKVFLVSQVASGYNWRSKPLRISIVSDLSPWLEWGFASHGNVSTGLFIPFCLKNDPNHTLQNELHYLCSSNLKNIIFYRYRIPFYVQRVCDENLSEDSNLIVEGIDDLTNIYDWVDEKINLLKT
jgi:hypothetical protein